MRRRSLVAIFALLGSTFIVGAPGLSPAHAAPAQAAGDTRLVPAAGTTSIRSLPFGSEGLQQPELRNRRQEQEGPASPASVAVNRAGPSSSPFPPAPLPPPKVRSSAVAGSDAVASVPGLNHRDQRLANGGNQFSLEPPDQALCVGNGFVVEGVNSALRVHNTTGAAVTGVQDINTFFGYPAAIDRTTGLIGPRVIDPICHYDPDNNRFIVVITTLHVVPETGDFTGRNTLDVAVSNTGDPTGAWTLYKMPVQNDGTEGTPDHGCSNGDGSHGPCFQDYPHIGGDKNGVYVSTNEYDTFGSGFNAAQIFAFSKKELAAHGPTVRMTMVQNTSVGGTPGFTVWPATSPKGEYANAAGGTEFMLSTIAGDGTETGNPTRTANKIGVWALSNTKSLDAATPALVMRSRLINSEAYVFPPTQQQKPGPFPLGECVNDTTMVTPFGPGCWQFLFTEEPAHDEVIGSPDSLDTRMQQTWYVNGQLWGAAGTAVEVNGEVRAGIAWFRVVPAVAGNNLLAVVLQQGYLALANHDLTMPAIAVGTNGKGAMAFTVTGDDHYPSAAYARVDLLGRFGPIRIAAEGVGVDDGFTNYKAFVGDPPRTRWGDYGAAVTDGRTIWIASEYIAQSCTLAEWATPPIGGCNGTRTALANWATRLTKLNT